MIPPRRRRAAGKSADEVCTVIPVYNEAGTIGRVVRQARLHCERVLVVDDGSTDGSAHVADAAGAFVVRHGRRRGKGAALRTGLQTVFAPNSEPTESVRRPKAVLLMDGDGQHDPCEIPRFLTAFARGADFVVGDRSLAWSTMAGAMPRTRLWANRAMTCALRPLLRFELRDSQCGFRLVSAGLWSRLQLESNHFEIESETLLAASRNGITPVYVPVSVRYGGERSKIRPLVDGLRFVRLLARSVPRSELPVADARSEPARIGRAYG